MSATPQLTKAQLYHSHLVNCKECHARIKGNPNIIASSKIVDLLCPVGKKLFFEAIKEDPKSTFKPTSFPFVAKLYQIVLARTRDGWIKGKVVDRSLSADGAVVGYEVEYELTSTRFGKPEKRRVYVNRFNIQKAGDGTPPKAQYVVETSHFKIKIGEKVKPQPSEEQVTEKPRFKINYHHGG